MNAFEIPGIENVESLFGICNAEDFNEIRILSIETYYSEDRECFEKSMSLILKGKKGLIEFSFIHVQDFQLRTLEKLDSFQVLDMKKEKFDSKNYYFHDPISEKISGYAEFAAINICDEKFV